MDVLDPNRTESTPSRWQNPNTLRTLGTVLLVIALSFWLLDKLAVVLRPLLLAILMAYVLLPYHNRFRKTLPPAASVLVLAGCVVFGLGAVGFAVYASLAELQSDLPALQKRATGMGKDLSHWVGERAPWMNRMLSEGNASADAELAARIQAAGKAALTTAGGAVIEVMTAGLYLLFLLLGAGRLGRRVRGAYDPARADQILEIFGRINAAIISYLRAKVIASFLLAVTAGAVLAACGVRYALLWTVLTFVCNFIPYVGTVIAYVVPIAFAAVAKDPDGSFVLVAGLLLAAHVLSATVIEPTVLGKAVGLSPLVILAALALWGSIWGIFGMFMAVPLTVVVLIVLEHFEASRPVARLLSE